MRHGQRLESGKLFVDNTLLSAEARCQTAASIRHIFEYATDDESVTLVSGQAIHLALEVFFKGGAVRDAMWSYDQFYEPKWERFARTQEVIEALGGDMKMASDRRSYQNVRTVLRQWFETHPREALPFVASPASVEASFEVPLVPDENIWYTGTPDVGEVTIADGSRYAVDHKSTGRITSEWRRGFRTSGQVSGYLWGLQQATGKVYTGMFINAIEVTKVPTSTRKCTEHGVAYAECGVLHCTSDLFPVQRTEAELERWKQNAVWLAKRYAKRLEWDGKHEPVEALATTPQEGKLTGACGYCPHYDFCASGQSPLLLEARYVKKPWDPAERRASGEEE